MGVGVGVDPDDVQRLGWVDQRSANEEEAADSGIHPPLPGGHDPRRAKRPDRDAAHARHVAKTR